jgi:hypothetical protein
MIGVREPRCQALYRDLSSKSRILREKDFTHTATSEEAQETVRANRVSSVRAAIRRFEIVSHQDSENQPVPGRQGASLRRLYPTLRVASNDNSYRALG